MKRTIFSLLAIMSLFLTISAQEGIDQLILKNGSIVHGKILGITSTEYRIKTVDGLVFVFSKEDIEKFVLGTKPVVVQEPVEVIIKRKETGLGFGIESGFMIGSSNEHFFMLVSFNPMISYTIKNRHVASLVSGVELFDEGYIPVMLEYRYNIFKSNVTPFIYGKGGALIATGDVDYIDYKGGWTAGLGTGIRWPIGPFESFVKFGFKYALTVEDRKNEYGIQVPQIMTYESNFYRIEFKWGFKF
jgi:hypothetical protein